MSGVGKTSHISKWLAYKLDNKQIAPERVQYFDLSGISADKKELLARQIMSVMQAQPTSLDGEIQVEQVLSRWRTWCQKNVDLVIYDAIEAEEIVSELRVAGPTKSIFLSTLTLTDADVSYSLAVLPEVSSAELIRGIFSKCGRSIRTEQIKKISVTCEGLPLALQAASSALALLPPGDLDYGLDQFVELSSMSDLSESWDAKVMRRLTACVLLLPEEKQRPWAALAQFEGAFFAFQAGIVWGHEQPKHAALILSQLVNRSLLQSTPGLIPLQGNAMSEDKLADEYAAAYQMHRLFRAVAAKFFPVDDRTRSGYGQAIFETLGRANQFSRTSKYGKIGYALNRHTINDKYPGFDALATTETVSEAEFLAEFPLFGVHQLDVPPAKRLEWLDKAAEVLTTRLQNSENFSELFLKVRFSQAQQLDELARYEEALRIIDEVYPLTDDSTDQRASLDTLLAVVLGHAGACTDALMHNTKALKHWILVGNDRERSTAYNNRGLLYLGTNDLRRAIRFCEISLQIDRKQGLDAEAAFNLQNLAQMYLMVHQDNKALERADEAEEICNSIQNKSLLPSVMQVQGNLALRRFLSRPSSEETASDQGHLHRAINRYEEALAIEKSMERPVKIVAALQNLAAATLYVPETGPQRAAELNAEAINLSEDCDIPWASVSARRNLGHIFYISGHTEDAVNFYEDALTTSRAKLAAFQHLQVIDGFTDILLRELPARHTECRELLQEGLELSEKSGLPQFGENFKQRLSQLGCE